MLNGFFPRIDDPVFINLVGSVIFELDGAVVFFGAGREDLDRQVGRTVMGLVEGGGVARGEDFTEIAFTGAATVGAVAAMTVTGHDGKRAIAHAALLEAAE